MYFKQVFLKLIIGISFFLLFIECTVEQPHWSVNNIQFSNMIRPQLLSQTSFSSNIGKESKPNRMPKMHSQRTLKPSMKQAKFHRVAFDRNSNARMGLFSRYLKERQNQRHLSAFLMSSFGSKVVNGNIE